MVNNDYTEKYIDFHESKIYVRVSGDGEPLILLHGLGADHTMWNKNISTLNNKFKVYAIDLPGFGKSDKPDTEYSIAFFSDAIRRVVESEGLEKVYLVGASLGGRIVLDLAIKFPEIVDKIVVVAPAGLSKIAMGIFGSAIGGEIITFALSKKLLVKKILTEMVYDSKWVTPSLINSYTERSKDKNYQRAFKRTGNALGENIDNYIEDLSKLKINTLIIWGEDDKIVPVKDGYYLHKIIKDSKLVIFGQCGHLSFLEKTQPFNKVVIDFLTVNNI